MGKSNFKKFTAGFLASLMMLGSVSISAADVEKEDESLSAIEEVKELLGSDSYDAYALGYSGWQNAADTVKVDVASAEYKADPDDTENSKSEIRDDGEKGKVLFTPGAGMVSFKVNVPQDALYAIRVVYKPVESLNTSSIERVMRIDGAVPFKEAYYFKFSRRFVDNYTPTDAAGNALSVTSPSSVFYSQFINNDSAEGKIFTKDYNGNDRKPSKTEILEWSEAVLSDSSGFYIDPFKFAFTKGEHTISFESTLNEMLISEIYLEKCPETISYEEYKAQHAGAAAVSTSSVIKLQAEFPSATSDNTIYALNDRTSPITEPQSASKQVYNTIGGTKWQTCGQWVEWTINGSEVPETGFYQIIPRFKQETLAGMYSSRKITINGELPFKEASYLQFNYSDSWQCEPLNNGTTPFEFYLEQGKDYTIRMEVAFGNMADLLLSCQECLTDINNIYNSILRITGPSPDEYADYDFAGQIYDTILLMKSVSERLNKVVDEFTKVSGGSGSNIAMLEKVIYILDRMSSKEDEIAKNLENLKVNAGTLGTWITSAKQQALTLDYITIQSVNAEKPDATASLWDTVSFEFNAFIQSFFTDYSSLGSTEALDESEAVEVWIATSRDEAQVLRELVDKSCEVKVNVKLVAAGTLLPATLAGVGPDVSLATGQTDTINYAIRNAVVPLDGFDTFDEVIKRFSEEGLVSLRLEDPNTSEYHYYGIPERLSFSMLFYRKDIFAQYDLNLPETWNDLYELIPELQTKYMNIGFFSGAAGGQGLPALQMFLYQNNGELYADNGKKINLDSNVALDAFSQLCDLVQSYKFPRVYDLATYFRMGEMPLAIADYLTYNHFTIYATELTGLWEFTPLPGTVTEYNEDGTAKTINNASPCTVAASVMMRDESRSEKLTNDAWKFIDWWTTAPVQSEYARQYESIIGSGAKFNTANTEALLTESWTTSEKKNLQAQMSNLRGTPEYPGGYIITRYVEFAFLDAYNNNADPVQAMLDNISEINKEITRKRKEFGLAVIEN